MASQELKKFLSRVNPEYLVHADALYQGEFTNQAELGAADRADLEDVGVRKGAAGLIIEEAGGTGASFAAWISGASLFLCSMFYSVFFGDVEDMTVKTTPRH